MRATVLTCTLAVATAVLAGHSFGQLITKVDAIPDTGKPPVVFLNGYQLSCDGSSFQSTFAAADQILQQDGRVSLFFDNCAYGRVGIEELGNKFGEFLRSLRYEGGQPPTQVDIVAHSMGGLIARSYLAGKQPQEGVFTPPAETKIRKMVFLATPHFGTGVTNLLGPSSDPQITALEVGSSFVFDLATWNQGTDDLRGADAIAVLGDAGSGLVGMRGFDDAVTSLTSGSLGFVLPNRTRVLPYCHTDGIALFGCNRGASPIAQMNSTDHFTSQILLSFLNGTEAWRNIGQAAEQHDLLSKKGGLLLRYKDANDRTQTPQSAQTAGSGNLSIRLQIAYSEFLPIDQPLQVTLALTAGPAALSVPLTTAATRAVTLKPGPTITAVFPSASAVYPRALAPGMLISIYGSQLIAPSGETEVTIAGHRVPVTFAGPNQINTSAPENISGLVKLLVKNAGGEQAVNVLVESAVPALFAPARNATTGTLVTPQTPIRPGDFVSLFLTGLGRTTNLDGLQWADLRPDVFVGGQPCALTFAGRAPGFPGLDQINCQLSSTLPASDSTPIVVRSGSRFSNETALSVR